MSVEIKLGLPAAIETRDALTTVLEEADIHSDEAQHLEVLRDILDYKIEKLTDYATDVDIY